MKTIEKIQYLKPQAKMVLLPKVALMQTSGEPPTEDPEDEQLLEYTNEELADPSLIIY